MALKIIVPGPWRPRHYLNSTNQGGPMPAPGVPDDLNVGTGGISVVGTPTSPPLNAKLQAVVSGAPGTATLKASLDGGTNWLGRKDHATWDGNGASYRSVVTGGKYLVGAETIDTNSDGVPDTVVAAVFDGVNAIDLYRTTDLSGAGSWSLWVSDIHDPNAVPDIDGWAGALILYQGALCLFYQPTLGDIVINRCVNLSTCATWSTVKTIHSGITDTAQGFDVCALQSGELALVFAYDDGSTYTEPHIMTTQQSILSWSSPVKIEATGYDTAAPTVVQDHDGKTWIFFTTYNPDAAVQAWSTTEADPAEETSFSSETIFTNTHAGATAVVAPNGHIYVVCNSVGAAPAGDLDFSYYNGSAWSALATCRDDATYNLGGVGTQLVVVGGALWLFHRYAGVTNDLHLILTKYWTTYNVSTAPASWTYPDTTDNPAQPQYLTPNVWFYVRGDVGSFFGDDLFVLGSASGYHPRRILTGTPRHPCRSTGHNGAWQAVFDLGASAYPGAVDSVAGSSNLPELSVDFADSDSWPGTGVTLTATEETIASAGITIGTYTIKRTAGTWEKHYFRGRNCMAYLTTSDYAVPISDNSADTLFLGGSVSGKTGDLRICAPATHETVAALSSGKRMMRVHAGSTENSQGYYEIRWVVAGLGYTFRSIHAAAAEDEFAHELAQSSDGSEFTRVAGPQRRRWVLHAPNVRGTQWKAMSAIIRAAAGLPFAFIWDTSDAHAVALVTVQNVTWDGAGVSRIVLREVC